VLILAFPTPPLDTDLLALTKHRRDAVRRYPERS
jgi:hypothetical protein